MNEGLQVLYYVLSGVAVLLVLLGLILQSKVKSALLGNLLALGATVLAIALVIVCYYKAGTLLPVYIALGLGALVGIIWAVKAKMIAMPQTVALLNGLGGAASAFVAAAALIQASKSAETAGFTFENVTSGLAIVIGGVTLTGSLIAAGKLARILKPAPKRLPGHTAITLVMVLLMVACLMLGLLVHPAFYIVLGVLALLFGILFVMRVGGADMPITISLLNSLSGVAGGIAGMAVGDPLLVCVGGIVGASGLLLTQNMCKAMNRKLSAILTGATTADGAKKAPEKAVEAVPAEPAPEAAKEAKAAVEAVSEAEGAVVEQVEEAAAEAVAESSAEAAPEASETPVEAFTEEAAAELVKTAKKVILVAGYGMALSQAQADVAQLARVFTKNGAEVKFAIHPVAGRMPGHMSVLLCEADVDYDALYMMEDINPEFATCDIAISVGANDVTNPAANTAEGTPIYGMPVLNLGDAPKRIMCCFDTKPGYAGVPNPLFTDPNTLFLEGDAKDSVQKILGWLK
ncbi:MAG: NAD(P)(+) transhydrogenase (Re/Si-specific) subunit beta [Lachnospiraceae bacterium]|nr:NAD(P)(+) transhydrogenase (Re/Si-specific) subunit beta [Lachnospiraceae bacterium]